MIFVTDASGLATFTSPDWTRVTGQAPAEATGDGWLARVHADDRETARAILAEATRLRVEFSLRYRLCTAAGAPIWVHAGAVPSFGPPNTTFLGFFGSISETEPDPAQAATGAVGRYQPPPPPDAPQGTVLERVADHLLYAHALIDADGAKEVLPPIREALLRIGRALARTQDGVDGSLN
ncbi:PAS domain-containing protein [Methylobacterium dankookense]|uniref:histidine kinase n=1 Tax=Methylobacterium dankookense TaxID=560405 RepID=A0A564G461_9HYPH|nr:PAS domain-containing protein [Methylobacterium dankookense]GJD58669.1 hypothetical protein IFDJLNFL_4592 [Methylobacterium dankookense]VUF15285.1 hypothetical protein MTDSW087_05023 [Methylobacterium dankookense]